MPQLIVELGSNVDLLVHLEEVDEVLRVWFRDLRCWNARFVVDLFILLDGLGKKLLSLRRFRVEI